MGKEYRSINTKTGEPLAIKASQEEVEAALATDRFQGGKGYDSDGNKLTAKQVVAGIGYFVVDKETKSITLQQIFGLNGGRYDQQEDRAGVFKLANEPAGDDNTPTPNLFPDNPQQIALTCNQIFSDLNSQVLASQTEAAKDSGSTLTLALAQRNPTNENELRIVTASTGDSSTYLIIKEGDEFTVKRLNKVLHNPVNELKRLQKNTDEKNEGENNSPVVGARGGTLRLKHKENDKWIAISRGFGATDFLGVIATPDVHIYDIDTSEFSDDTEFFLLQASDGLTESCTRKKQNDTDYIKGLLLAAQKKRKLDSANFFITMVHQAYSDGSTDNISINAIKLNPLLPEIEGTQPQPQSENENENENESESESESESENPEDQKQKGKEKTEEVAPIIVGFVADGTGGAKISRCLATNIPNVVTAEKFNFQATDEIDELPEDMFFTQEDIKIEAAKFLTSDTSDSEPDSEPDSESNSESKPVDIIFSKEEIKQKENLLMQIYNTILNDDWHVSILGGWTVKAFLMNEDGKAGNKTTNRVPTHAKNMLDLIHEYFTTIETESKYPSTFKKEGEELRTKKLKAVISQLQAQMSDSAKYKRSRSKQTIQLYGEIKNKLERPCGNSPLFTADMFVSSDEPRPAQPKRKPNTRVPIFDFGPSPSSKAPDFHFGSPYKTQQEEIDHLTFDQFQLKVKKVLDKFEKSPATKTKREIFEDFINFYNFRHKQKNLPPMSRAELVLAWAKDYEIRKKHNAFKYLYANRRGLGFFKTKETASIKLFKQFLAREIISEELANKIAPEKSRGRRMLERAPKKYN